VVRDTTPPVVTVVAPGDIAVVSGSGPIDYAGEVRRGCLCVVVCIGLDRELIVGSWCVGSGMNHKVMRGGGWVGGGVRSGRQRPTNPGPLPPCLLAPLPRRQTPSLPP
jgi:hypothetical protein